MNMKSAKFSIGQLVNHRLLNYRGIIVDVDAQCEKQKWQSIANGLQGAHNGPWYRILVDEASYITYVSEQELLADFSDIPVEHPFMDKFFEIGSSGDYIRKQKFN